MSKSKFYIHIGQFTVRVPRLIWALSTTRQEGSR